MTPPALFTLAPTPIEERASTSDYHAARSAGWAWQRNSMMLFWLAKIEGATTNSAREYYQAKLTYLKGVRE